MLYSETLEALANQFCSDLYILPSSVHEVLAVPVNDSEMDADELAGLVSMSNHDPNAVTEEAYLSDSVYRYSREKGEITTIA